MPWNPAHLPRQDGRLFVVTGGNAGVGYFTAEQLARTGARVVLASRDLARADVAMTAIRGVVPDADLASVHLDLESLESVRRTGDHLAGFDHIDGLVLNAGMTTGSHHRQVTRDHHELTFGTNYLGHFASPEFGRRLWRLSEEWTGETFRP